MNPCNCEPFQSCEKCKSKGNMTKIICGVDPGTKTGVAIWDCEKQIFRLIETVSIIKAMSLLHPLESDFDIDIIRFEDARLRKWFGKSGREVLQGVGSIKRDCSIWQEFCEYHSIKFEAVKPATGQTKWKSDYFKRVTGWEKRTSEHSRDAAVLVYRWGV